MNDKKCTKCGLIKPLFEFYDTPSRGHTYKSAACIPCHNALSKENHGKRMSSDVRYKAVRLLRELKNRSERNGLTFDLDLDWLLDRLSAGKCEVTGIELNVFDNSGIGERPWGPSVDRTDPKQGYTKDNSKVVCWIYNRAKGCSNHEDVVKLCKAIASNDN